MSRRSFLNFEELKKEKKEMKEENFELSNYEWADTDGGKFALMNIYVYIIHLSLMCFENGL